MTEQQENLWDDTFTGVDDQNDTFTEVDDQNDIFTGVDNKDIPINNSNTQEQDTENKQDNTQSIPEEENDPDKYVTIGDINITSEMNASNRGAETEQWKMKGQI